ncbi:ras family small GTPase, partial [Naegleria gruberi]
MIIVGTGAVGKSAITIQFTQNIFDRQETYDPTIEDAYYCKRMIDGVGVELEIVDTAGQDDYIALRDTWMKSCYGFILVFDLTSYRTLEELKIFVEQIKRTKLDENKPLSNGNIFPGIILGNKCDLNFELSEKDVASFMKQELDIQVPILFTSAKTRVNIDEAFETVIREMRN